MKKVLLGSAVITALSFSIIAFQLSCIKTANAQTGGTSGIVQLNKIVYTIQDSINQGYSYCIFIANYDGSSSAKVNINLPSGVKLYTLSLNGGMVNYTTSQLTKLSPDGKTLFFRAFNTNLNTAGIYSCYIDGSNVKKVLDSSTNEPLLSSVN